MDIKIKGFFTDRVYLNCDENALDPYKGVKKPEGAGVTAYGRVIGWIMHQFGLATKLKITDKNGSSEVYVNNRSFIKLVIRICEIYREACEIKSKPKEKLTKQAMGMQTCQTDLPYLQTSYLDHKIKPYDTLEKGTELFNARVHKTKNATRLLTQCCIALDEHMRTKNN